jgi:hypothetical protein
MCGCRECDYDLCLGCAQQPSQYATAPLPPGSGLGLGPGAGGAGVGTGVGAWVKA